MLSTLPVLVDTTGFDKSLLPNSVYNSDQVRRIDSAIIEGHGISGLSLMRRAAQASLIAIFQHWPLVKRIRIYCGSGNNAADGYIVAALLMERQLEVEVVIVGDTQKLSSDGQRAYRYCLDSGASMVSKANSKFAPDLIVDALLGTGFHNQMRDAYALCIEEINASKVPILALDLPSGLFVDTGSTSSHVVMADVTVTFIGLKRGLLTGPGVDCTGHLYFAPLVDEVVGQEAIEAAIAGVLGSSKDYPIKLLKLDELRSKLPLRPKDSHKYRFGHVLVIGGDVGMGGAPLMTALAAMRCGAGMVTIATHPQHAATLNQQHPELMVRGIHDASGLEPLLEKATVLALGPGLGRSEWSEQLSAVAIDARLPMVVDADGLNILADNPEHRDNWILTPHPGEASRLLHTKKIQENRVESAVELQAKYGGVIALKGAGTLVASATGDLSLCPYGNPGMSTAGMGDVLCGVVAGLLAEFGDIEFAGELGVVLHSAAADQCVAEQGMRGLMATDLIPMVRRLLNAV